MPYLTLLVLEVFQQKKGLITGLKTDLIIGPTPKQFKVKDWSYLNSLYMYKSNKTKGNFDPVLSSLAGLFICYPQRAAQNWTWDHRNCHAPSGFLTGYPGETTKYTSSDTQDWGQNTQGKNAGRKGTQKDDLQQNLHPFTRVKHFLGESGTQRSWRLQSSELQLQKANPVLPLANFWVFDFTASALF